MVLSSAEKFILEIAENNELRKSFYGLSSMEEIKSAINQAGFDFKIYEYEESILNLKTKCSSEEDAIALDELLLWWQMLLPEESAEDSRSSCTPADCFNCPSCG